MDTLIGQVRASGLPVELTVTGEDDQVPPGVDLSAYRIVQESLTNVLRHAGPASAQVRIEYGADSLRLVVRDDGPGSEQPGGGGNGLVGIRERVAIVGGTVSAQPRPEGGFEVDARLPYALEVS